MTRALNRRHGPTIAIGLVMLLIALALAILLAASAVADTPQETTPVVVVKKPDKVKGCTQKRFRYVVRKAYSKNKVTKSDHERIYRARICLKHQQQAKDYQRRQGEIRRERLDPWGYAWSKVDTDLKYMLKRLRHCESTNNYLATNGTHWGAYQYDIATWAEAGGTGRADQASPREQDVRTARFFPGHQSRWNASRHCWG